MQKITPLNSDTYLAVIKNSIGSKSFRTLYAKVGSKKTDIARGGDLSCAFFVSSVLVIFKMIDEIHATVDSTVRDMEHSGWKEIRNPKIGCIIVWERGDQKGSVHKHIGFYIGAGKAVSNSYLRGTPVAHEWTMGKRKVEKLLWHRDAGR